MADAEDEDYHYFGTPIEDEAEGKAGQYRKPVKDPAALRALPIWKQEATDEQGRKRFHGAFTGGFSAGYFNTVGSAVSSAALRSTPPRAGPSCGLRARGTERAAARVLSQPSRATTAAYP